MDIRYIFIYFGYLYSHFHLYALIRSIQISARPCCSSQPAGDRLAQKTEPIQRGAADTHNCTRRTSSSGQPTFRRRPRRSRGLSAAIRPAPRSGITCAVPGNVRRRAAPASGGLPAARRARVVTRARGPRRRAAGGRAGRRDRAVQVSLPVRGAVRSRARRRARRPAPLDAERDDAFPSAAGAGCQAGLLVVGSSTRPCYYCHRTNTIVAVLAVSARASCPVAASRYLPSRYTPGSCLLPARVKAATPARRAWRRAHSPSLPAGHRCSGSPVRRDGEYIYACGRH